MSEIRVGDIARPITTLAPDDSLRRASELLAGSSHGAVPVADGDQIVGIVTSQSIAASIPSGEADEAKSLPVSRALIPSPVIVPSMMRVDAALEVIRSTGAPALIVSDSTGQYYGLVGDTELLSALWGSLRLPSIAGMATPLGVHLTTGSHRAGPGSPGLLLTGMALALLSYVALGLVDLMAWGLTQLGIPVMQMLNSPYAGTTSIADLVTPIQTVLQFVLFLLLVRLSPLSGYHAAEHQVVHAIEQNQDLVPEKVRLMPRPHPRCGTNLLVVFGCIGVVWGLWTISSALIGEIAGQVLTLLVAMYFLMTWRRFGWLLQQYFTTSPASDNQLRHGIRSGEELAQAYRQNPGKPAGIYLRIWNAGFIQVLAGFFIIFGIGQSLISWLQR